MNVSVRGKCIYLNTYVQTHLDLKKINRNLQWEAFQNKPTNMDPNIETTIRIYIYDKMFVRNNADKIKFYDQYQAITEIMSKQKLSQVVSFSA